MFAAVVLWITAVIAAAGYVGVFFLMAAESMVLPVPSEAVLPFAGFLVAQGQFSFWEVALVSAAGCLFGSLLSYAIGYYGATPLVRRFGTYVLVEEKHLDHAQRWFARFGGVTVFVCRFIPVIRHISSIPAGAAKMNLVTFSFYTFVGALLWNSFLLWLGLTLGAHWQTVLQYTPIVDAVVVLLLIGGLIYLVGFVQRARIGQAPLRRSRR